MIKKTTCGDTCISCTDSEKIMCYFVRLRIYFNAFTGTTDSIFVLKFAEETQRRKAVHIFFSKLKKFFI